MEIQADDHKMPKTNAAGKAMYEDNPHKDRLQHRPAHMWVQWRDVVVTTDLVQYYLFCEYNFCN